MLLFASDSTNSDYSFGARLLHHLALGLPWLSKASFDIDGFLSYGDQKLLADRHVFICGLARSGTTMLLRTLYHSGQFRSLTYCDMPFVLMPRTWGKLTSAFQKKRELKERAHGDGIDIDYDSPEAFEEVFWRTFAGQNYILADRLLPHFAGQELIERFRLYVRRILDSSNGLRQDRYLSKNNNNILRLPSIQKAFPAALIIVPFRDPVQQASSLMEQHLRFSNRHRVDKFSCDYMRWLGHHEFGMIHKPFCFSDGGGEFSSDYRTDDINYWLSIWISTYQYLLDSAPKGSVFISYEDLCHPSGDTLRYLYELAGVSYEINRLSPSLTLPPSRRIDGIDQQIVRKGQATYENLLLKRQQE